MRISYTFCEIILQVLNIYSSLFFIIKVCMLLKVDPLTLCVCMLLSIPSKVLVNLSIFFKFWIQDYEKLIGLCVYKFSFQEQNEMQIQIWYVGQE